MQLTTFFHSYPLKKLNFKINQSRPYLFIQYINYMARVNFLKTRLKQSF